MCSYFRTRFLLNYRLALLAGLEPTTEPSEGSVLSRYTTGALVAEVWICPKQCQKTRGMNPVSPYGSSPHNLKVEVQYPNLKLRPSKVLNF